ncbi:hypothetical protein LTR37_004889 [Vermiconidia calcicola]|uniref:Uncharacterized protein n=1 Tax=Vermiconidia calcicola TaxID=1690605 RepID=A0ACC3NKI3_9PEZI|nr:hypothetical protein LTR37_004889 [Vermiconidia calcicola]
MDVLEPRKSRREKKLHLSYELPNRIHCSQIYPLQAPNGSTVILYGHDRGLRVLWRGGKRPKEPDTKKRPPKGNGVNNKQDVIVIDDSDDEPQQNQPEDTEDQYEDEEDEQDPDCPYPQVIQDLDVDLGTEVLHIAIPSITSAAASQIRKRANTHIVVVIGCSDTKLLLMTIPLKPPTFANKQEYFQQNVTELKLEGGGSIAHGLAVKFVAKEDDSSYRSRSESTDGDGRLLIAAVAKGLSIWSLNLTKDTVSSSKPLSPLLRSAVTASTVTLQSSLNQNLVLVVDRSGIVRTFDPFTSSENTARPSSRGSESATPPSQKKPGQWVMSYHTPFHTPKNSPALARRKKILSASWILGARSILVLLEDGEWGIWDLYGTPQAGKNTEDFALHGYLDSSSTPETADLGKQRKAATKLAPMTPNTRKAKSENLFSGTPKASGGAPSGGISVSTSSGRSGQVDESIIMWYNSEIYSIPSMQSFWQRSTNNTGGGFGSLYAPGLTHISDVNFMNENITSISQFASSSATSSLGQMNTPRDLLVSAEHRFIVLQSLKPPAASKMLFQPTMERPASRDQRMVDVGELDLGGIDSMLDGMAGDGRARRVGFAR